MVKVAWQITEECDGNSVIVFHHHGLAARREGANELWLEFDDVTCVRASYLDEYAEKGVVPRKVFLEVGWWFGCNYCCNHVTEDDIFIFNNYYCSFKCWFNDKIISVLKGKS